VGSFKYTGTAGLIALVEDVRKLLERYSPEIEEAVVIVWLIGKVSTLTFKEASKYPDTSR
jgi:hypothetical protein